MPEIPKKKVPEEKRPVPQKEEEVPPPKGIASLSFQEPSYIILCDKANDSFVSSVILSALWVYICVWGWPSVR